MFDFWLWATSIRTIDVCTLVIFGARVKAYSVKHLGLKTIQRIDSFNQRCPKFESKSVNAQPSLAYGIRSIDQVNNFSWIEIRHISSAFFRTGTTKWDIFKLKFSIFKFFILYKMHSMIIGILVLKRIESSYPIMDLHEIHDYHLDSFYRTPLSSMYRPQYVAYRILKMVDK